MWYFSWILGVLLACAFGIINVMWYECRAGGFEDQEADEMAGSDKTNT